MLEHDSNQPQLATALAASTRFARLVRVVSCDSTQQLASAAYADSGAEAPDGVFWADHQTSGRGRQQREWHDEPGLDLAVTFRVREQLPEPLALPAALPVAVLRAIERLTSLSLRIKWPNDLILDGKKLSGVLIDRDNRDPDVYLIGVGINVNRTRFPRDLEPIATSLALASGRETNRAQLLLAVAQSTDAMVRDIAAGRQHELLALFRDRLQLLGKSVEVDAGDLHTGILTAIDFAQLQLDDQRRIPLGIVRSLRAR